VFGSIVDTTTDQVGKTRPAQARLSDGYGQHYVYIDAGSTVEAKAAPPQAPRRAR
jgi:hypothetical protein